METDSTKSWVERYKEEWMSNKKFIDMHSIRIVDKIESVSGSELLVYDRCVCPCGGKDHYALWPRVDHVFHDGRSHADLLTCFRNNQQWLVRWPSVKKVIESEEMSFYKLMEMAPGIVRRVIAKRGWSEETISFLFDTHGIDRETAEMCYESLNKSW